MSKTQSSERSNLLKSLGRQSQGMAPQHSMAPQQMSGMGLPGPGPVAIGGTSASFGLGLGDGDHSFGLGTTNPNHSQSTTSQVSRGGSPLGGSRKLDPTGFNAFDDLDLDDEWPEMGTVSDDNWASWEGK